MTEINFQPADQSKASLVTLDKGESVLEGLLRTGHDIPYGCCAGVCQSCVMQSCSEDIPAVAQKGLKDSQKTLGYFLPCVCKPEQNMNVSKLTLANDKSLAGVVQKDYLTDEIVRLRLEKVFDYKPGQFCTLWKDNKIGRCYSIASIPQQENFIEFHIKKIQGGEFSEWAYDVLQPGDVIDVQGPMGECFYTPSDTAQALFLAGIGTGLAPLYGVVRDALQQGHNGLIHLVIGAKESANYYMIDELVALENQYTQLTVHFVTQSIQETNSNANIVEADIYQYIKTLIPDFKGQRVFLCGAESFVQKMKRLCFMSGANMPDISADAFLSFNR